MSSPVHFKFFGKTEDKSEQEYLYMLSVKTQYAGIEIHNFIVDLFRYLKQQKYFDHFEMHDDGKFWETGDENIMQDMSKQYTEVLDKFSLALDNRMTDKIKPNMERCNNIF